MDKSSKRGYADPPLAADGLLMGLLTSPLCMTCADEGWTCFPHSEPQCITCPGEECATCDYAWEEGDDE